jgi:hypothetical protein
MPAYPRTIWREFIWQNGLKPTTSSITSTTTSITPTTTSITSTATNNYTNIIKNTH